MVALLDLLCSALLECVSDHRAYTQELSVVAGALSIQRILFQDLLDHLIDLIRGLDLGLTLVDKQWLEPVLIDPGDCTLEPAQLGSLLLIILDVVCAQVRRGEHGWVGIRVQHG